MPYFSPLTTNGQLAVLTITIITWPNCYFTANSIHAHANTFDYNYIKKYSTCVHLFWHENGENKKKFIQLIYALKFRKLKRDTEIVATAFAIARHFSNFLATFALPFLEHNWFVIFTRAINSYNDYHRPTTNDTIRTTAIIGRH